MIERLISYPKQQTDAEIKAGKPVEIISFMQEYDPDKPCYPRGVKDTSKEAFAKYKANVGLNAGQKKVYEFIKNSGQADMTRQEIAVGSGIGINVVTPRVRELLDLGSIIELPKRICKKSGTEMAHALRIA